MNLLPRDFTEQENLIAECLDEFGIRYEQQLEFYPYTVDFFVADIKMVIEADGFYGHLQKQDAKRDEYLLKHKNIDYVIHIKEKILQEIKDKLWLELNKLNPSSQKTL